MNDNRSSHNDSDYRQWLSGIPYEIAFWNNVFRWDSTFNGMMGWSKFGRNIQLDGMDVTTLLNDCENPTILDIGCGLSFANGDKFTSTNGEEDAEDLKYKFLIDFLLSIIKIVKGGERWKNLLSSRI